MSSSVALAALLRCAGIVPGIMSAVSTMPEPWGSPRERSRSGPPEVHAPARVWADRQREGASDTELIGLAFDLWAERIYTVANQILASRSEAEDIVQQVFETLLKKLHDIRDPQRVPGFLHTCAIRASCRRLKRAARAPRSPDERRQAAGAGAEPTIVATTRQLLERLDPEERTAIVLKLVHGYGHDEVADLMGLSVSTVRRRIDHARAKIRAALAGASGEWR